MDDKTVSFTYKDYRDNQNKILTLTGEEFIRRYLQHILPSGFMRMRHYGWLSKASCKKKLVIIKEAIKTYQTCYHLVTKEIKHIVIEIKQDVEGITCPKCKKAMMKIIGYLFPLKKIQNRADTHYLNIKKRNKKNRLMIIKNISKPLVC